MKKKSIVVTTTSWINNDDAQVEHLYEGDVDAQLHQSGALIIVEYTPNIAKADDTKKADLIAIFPQGQWDKAETK